MLPNISLNSPINSQDTGKQISMLRSQMASLKEAIEDELQSISYDQLDAALRKKIDSLNDSLGMAVEQTAIVAQTLKAKYITADEISARYATFGTVNAVSARVSKIESNYISTDVLDVTTLITTTNFAAQEINAGKITAGTIDVARLSGDVITTSNASTKFKTLTVKVNILEASGITLGGANLGLSEVLINGTKYKLVTWTGGVV